MSRTVFYCRCGERIEGAAARIDHMQSCDGKRKALPPSTDVADKSRQLLDAARMRGTTYEYFENAPAPRAEEKPS